MARGTLALFLTLLLATLSGCAPRATEGILVSSTVQLEPPPPPPPPPPPEVNLVFVGDIMLARTPGEWVERGEDPFESFGEVLRSADLAVGNLECVIAAGGTRVPKAYNFRCHPRNVPLLAKHLGAVSVANNHSGDYGHDAFAEQLDLLEKGGVPYFGGGRNLQEAHRPLVLERKGFRIALLGYNEVELRSFAAGPSRPGLAWSDDTTVVADIEAARREHGAHLVVVYPHWGIEYKFEPSDRQRYLARKMIDAGADLVVGAHPHVTQTVEYYRDRLIVYSLGNFVFDDFMDVPSQLNEPSRTSWVLRVTLQKDGKAVRWDTLVARTDDKGFPRPLKSVESPCGSALTREIRWC